MEKGKEDHIYGQQTENQWKTPHPSQEFDFRMNFHSLHEN